MAHSDDTEMLRQLYGYASGGAIPETTWLVSQHAGLPYVVAGEDEPEDVVPRRHGSPGIVSPIADEDEDEPEDER